MPNDPLALILAGLPDEADYDAVHAAIMATERGRRFLTEYADRNRHADTAMIVGAIARIEAAIRGDGAPRADAAGDLLEIAAAIDRIRAAIAAGTAPAPDVSTAIERLLDIAFMLHERPVEATLCDGLDAAIREISEAGARSEPAAEGLRNAAELLAALAERVSGMIARAPNADQPSGENVWVDSTSGAGFFELAANDGETFAQAVAALAASLPTLGDAPNEPAEAAPEPASGQGAQVPAADTVPSDDALLPAAEAQQIAVETRNSDNAAAPPQLASTEVSLSEAVLNQAFSDDHFASANISREAPAREETESEPALNEEPPSEAVLPAQNFSTERVADPEEDPADLFEPQPVATPPAETAAPVTPDAGEPAEPPVEPSRAVPPPPARAIPRPPGSDPLAAVRDLSEEELIALFS
jgi:chemotaxis protein histidine kinase CheA